MRNECSEEEQGWKEVLLRVIFADVVSSNESLNGENIY